MQGWTPAGDGIFYSADMGFFYNTFYRYPEGNWRYILGLKPALMPPEDLKVFRNIQWNQFAWETYKPWIAKMRARRIAWRFRARCDLNCRSWNGNTREIISGLGDCGLWVPQSEPRLRQGLEQFAFW